MQQFIDPLTLSRVKDLPLVAKIVAQGFLHGLHTSMQRGSGIEFSQYRVYEPGDDLAKIDWKLFARSDRYFVREAERESNLNVWLVMDASESMLHRSDAEESKQGWTKFEYARHLLATVGYIAQKQGDGVGFLGVSSEQATLVPANNGQRHWQKVQLELARIKPGGKFPRLKALQNQLAGLRRNSLVFLVSDFYQHDSELVDFVSNLTNPNVEVVAVQLTSDDEIIFPYRGTIRFKDRETRQQIQVSATQIRDNYLKTRQQFQSDLNTQLSAAQMQHLVTSIEKPLDQVLYDFLLTRQKLG